MRICYLANTAIPSTNASAIQIVKMCETLAKLKQKVLLITTNVNDKDIFDFYGVKNKFNFKRISKFTKFPLGINYYFFSILSIIESLSFKPNIFITRNFFTCFLLIILKKKVILELHHGIENESRVVKFLVNNLNFLNSKYLIFLIAISEGAKLEYINKHNVKKEKIIVLPSGSSINERYEAPSLKKKYNIGYFGSLYESRGFNLIVNLAKVDNNNLYFIYGNTKNLDKLISKKKIKNLSINNFVPYKNIPKILKKIDIFLMPYVSAITVAGDVGDVTKFTSPLKLFDYLSVGRPIICSEIKILKEILKKNSNAIFIKNYTNIFSWKNEIQKILKNKEKIIIISKNNYKLGKKFNHEKRASLILEEIKKKINKNKNL